MKFAENGIRKSHAHLFKKHGLTIFEYKEKYGFSRSQPLEAFYVKSLRQKYNKRDKAYRYLNNSHAFKKGHAGRKDARRHQELIRLQKHNDRIKGKFLCITPAEVCCMFDLRYKLNYPAERIANIMKLSKNYVRNTLRRVDVYNHWKGYYKHT